MRHYLNAEGSREPHAASSLGDQEPLSGHWGPEGRESKVQLMGSGRWPRRFGREYAGLHYEVEDFFPANLCVLYWRSETTPGEEVVADPAGGWR
jgi:hypothetical protein